MHNTPHLTEVGLLTPYTEGNFGDGPIQEAVIRDIYKRYPHAKILGIALNPNDTEKRHGITSFPISWASMSYYAVSEYANAGDTKLHEAWTKKF